MIKNKITCLLVIFIFLGVLSGCNNNDAVMIQDYNNSDNSKKIIKDGQLDTQTSNNNTQTITDIENWNHPINKFFHKKELLKIEIVKQKTYPIFYVNHPIISKYEAINYYLDGTYSAMLKENGFWDFEIRGNDQKAIIIKGDKETKTIEEIFLDDEKIDIQKYDDEVKLVLNALKARIIKKDDSSDYYYFRSPYNQNKRPEYDEDFYLLNPITYDNKAKVYLILFSQKTDTVATYYYALLGDNKVSLYYDTPMYNGNEEEAQKVNYDFREVENLFINRYFVNNPNKDDNLLALKQEPNEFLYRVQVSEFDYSNNKYCITLGRSIDTVQNFFLYDADLDKFYREGATPEEIEDQSDVFVWMPF